MSFRAHARNLGTLGESEDPSLTLGMTKELYFPESYV